MKIMAKEMSISKHGEKRRKRQRGIGSGIE